MYQCMIRPANSQIGAPIFTSERVIQKDLSGNIGTLPVHIIQNTTAISILVKSLHDGRTLATKNSSTPLPVASIVKLVTAITALETLDSEERIMITPEALATYGDSAHLRAHEFFTRDEILWPILMMSSNDAAEAIARYSGRDNFVAHMNITAAHIGMPHSTWRDPSGISSGNVSTAEDLFLLARHISLLYPEIWEMTRTTQKTIAPSKKQYIFHTFNNPRHHPGFVGGKNGHTTAAKDTLLYLFENSRKEKIAYIILGSSDAEHDLELLLGTLQN